MATYLVTYDLNKEVRRPNIVEIIKSFPSYAMLSESSYAVVSSTAAGEVFNKFAKVLDANDTLYVIPLSRPYSGRGYKEVNEWLDSNL